MRSVLTMLVAGASGLLVGCGAEAGPKSEPEPVKARLGGGSTTDKTLPFASDDKEMNAAIDAAKHSFREFLEAYSQPKPGQTSFLVKVVFTEGSQCEHIWVADLDFSGSTPRGVIANEPALPSIEYLEHVEFTPNRITDWMYVDNGQFVGGFTTRVIRNRMSPEDRAALDASSPYKH